MSGTLTYSFYKSQVDNKSLYVVSMKRGTIQRDPIETKRVQILLSRQFKSQLGSYITIA